MKTLLIGLLIFSMLLPSILVADANIYEAGDFDKHPEQMVILEERDMVRINLGGMDHQLHVRAIYLDKKKVDLTAFIEGSQVPFYTTITLKTSLQLDFDRDDNFDLKVSIFNILEDDGEKVVALNLKKIEKEPSSITAAAVEKESKNRFYSFIIHKGLYFFIGIVLLSLGLGLWKRRFVLKNYRKLK